MLPRMSFLNSGLASSVFFMKEDGIAVKQLKKCRDIKICLKKWNLAQ